MITTIFTILVTIVLIVLYAKTDRITIQELIGGIAVVFLTFFVSRLILEHSYSQDVKIHTGNVIGRYYHEPYCYEVDHTERYACGTDSEGNTKYCTRHYTTTHRQSKEFFVTIAKDVAWPDREVNEKFLTRGDRLCSTRPMAIGKGNTEGAIESFVRELDETEWDRTKIGEIRTWNVSYFNPVKKTNDVIFSEYDEETTKKLEKFEKIYEVRDDRSERVYSDFAPDIGLNMSVERFNFDHRGSNMSVSFIITKDDDKFFQTLKRYLKNGKANDFIVYVFTKDGRNVDYLDVISWNNESLVTDLKFYGNSAKTFEYEEILDILRNGSKKFAEKNFEEYDYLTPEIPLGSTIAYVLLDLMLVGAYLFYAYSNEFVKYREVAYGYATDYYQRIRNRF